MPTSASRIVMTLCLSVFLLAWPLSTISAAPLASAPRVVAQQQQAPPPAQPPAQPPIVRGIEVRGNKLVPTADILALVTHTKVGAPLQQEDLQADVRAIVETGLFADVTARIERLEDGARIVFFVLENPVVAEIIVEGNTVIPTEQVIRALGVPLGQILNMNKLRAGARAVEALYEEKGYVLARIADIGIVPVDGGRLRVRIAEGRIEAIRFRGLRRTQPRTVQRQLTMKPGDVFNLNELNVNLQRVSELGLFETVRAQPEPGTQPDQIVVIIEVEEARTSAITGGLGYSSSGGLIGFAEYRDANWRGLAQTLSVRVERGILERGVTPRWNYDLSFHEPFLDLQRTSLDLSLYSRSGIEFEFKKGKVFSRYLATRSGSVVAVGRPIGREILVTGQLRSEYLDYVVLPKKPENPGSPKVKPTKITRGRLISVVVMGTRDTRNDRLNPTSGERQMLSFEVGLPVLGARYAFTKTSLEYQRLFPLGPDRTLVARGLLGYGTGNIPVQELFVVGGASTVRSIPYGALRGPSMFVANLEYRFPLGTLIKQLGEVQGIVFVDVGSAPIKFDAVKYGAGAGVAFKTPIGPIRLDVAFGQGTIQTWITVGSPF